MGMKCERSSTAKSNCWNEASGGGPTRSSASWSEPVQASVSGPP